MGQGMQVL